MDAGKGTGMFAQLRRAARDMAADLAALVRDMRADVMEATR